MIDFVNRFKIPTILGLGVILSGLVAGLYLVLREQVFFSKAAPQTTPQNIIISNITDVSATISFTTDSPSPAFITYGNQNLKEQTAMAKKDTIHYIALANLSPQTKYQFKIHTGKTTSEIFNFETLNTTEDQTTLAPVIGSIILEDNTPLTSGAALLFITESITQSSQVSQGNFLIPLPKIQQDDLPQTAKLTILSDKGEANALISLGDTLKPLPPIKLGQDVDLTAREILAPSPTTRELIQYDQNNDQTLNANDHAIVSSCINKKTVASCKEADINKDGKIDKKDLDLMFQKIKNQ